MGKLVGYEISHVMSRATGAIEGALFLKEKKLVNISEQNLIDCSYVEFVAIATYTLIASIA